MCKWIKWEKAGWGVTIISVEKRDDMPMSVWVCWNELLGICFKFLKIRSTPLKIQYWFLSKKDRQATQAPWKQIINSIKLNARHHLPRIALNQKYYPIVNLLVKHVGLKSFWHEMMFFLRHWSFWATEKSIEKLSKNEQSWQISGNG